MALAAAFTYIDVSRAIDAHGTDTWAAPVPYRFGPNERQVVVGADVGCDVRLDNADGTVSGQHLVLMRYGARRTDALVRDLASSNHSFVGGERASARPFEQLYFADRTRLFAGPYRIEVMLCAEADPWDRVIFIERLGTRLRSDCSATAIDAEALACAVPPILADLARPERRALVADVARWLGARVDRATMMDLLVRRLRHAMDARDAVFRLPIGARHAVLPADVGVVFGPAGGEAAVREGRCVIVGRSMVVPLWEGAGPQPRCIGDATLVRAPTVAPFDDDDARFVEAVAAWALQAVGTRAGGSETPRLARSWPLPLVGVSDLHQGMMAEVTGAAMARSRRVMLAGATGSGKTFIAAAIHQLDPAAVGPFDVVNCGVDDTVSMATELFGMRDVNSSQVRIGKLRACDRGTLLLDEVHALGKQVQEMLKTPTGDGSTSRVRFTKVGSTETEEADVRIVSATTKDPDSTEGRRAFDSALLRRLCDVIIRVPTLDERKQDIPLLALRLLDDLAARANVPALHLSADARKALRNHRWPENIAGLQKVLKAAFERALARSPRGDALDDRPAASSVSGEDAPGSRPPERLHGVALHAGIDVADLVFAAGPGPAEPAVEGIEATDPAAPTAEEAQLDAALRALEDCGGRIAAAAARLGVVDTTLYNLLDNWCVEREFGAPASRGGPAFEAEAGLFRAALVDAARDGVPGWNASNRDRAAFHERARSALARQGRSFPSLQMFRKRLDELRIARFHPRTRDEVRADRRRRSP